MLGTLTLDQLRVLVTIAETGSFSAAGRKLQRAQSAISHAVQTLEQVQRVQLFDRSGRAPVLTEAGRALVAQARQVLRQADLFERSAKAIAEGLEPELTFAVDGMVPTKPVIDGLAALRERFPDLAVTLFTEALGGAERRIRAGAATLGLCIMLPNQAQDLQAYPVASIELVPVAAPSHPLSMEQRKLEREVLAEHVQLVLTDPESAEGPSYSVVSPRVWRFVDLGRRLDFLLAGFGWATMPLHLIEGHLAAGKLKRLPIDDPAVLPGAIPIYAVHRRNHPLGIAARFLLDELQSRSNRP
ncbi:LysR family transcriptional regulator [Sphingomonas sp. BN140010]|uniref:LysR family transcriptional regulator n=1 Tax=Sphingomonas arvum TaxID=2992113 RepID=A0ABT3JBT8_9SPHN|nr:LysR family transcriptional regulator [Sphingomonas sp. BN140010]MCW3796499.1 LysR family transcriptional regulator [Sphingomonas sp. BN140010]